FLYEEGTDYLICDDDYIKYAADIQLVQTKIDAKYEELLVFVNTNQAYIISQCESNKFASINLLPFINEAENFINAVDANKDKKYVEKLFPELLHYLSELDSLTSEKGDLINNVIKKINCNGIQQISEGVIY